MVTFINEQYVYTEIDVIQYYSINEDELIDDSMPQDPIREGFTFKERNTKEDGIGDKFTGDTIVGDDMVVYSIYDKKDEAVNNPPVLKVKDTTINKDDDFDPMKLVLSASDKEDGDLLKDVKITNNGGFDTNKIGKYVINFKVSDSKNAKATEMAVANVVENEKETLPNAGNNEHAYYIAGLSISLLGLMFVYKKKLVK